LASLSNKKEDALSKKSSALGMTAYTQGEMTTIIREKNDVNLEGENIILEGNINTSP